MAAINLAFLCLTLICLLSLAAAGDRVERIAVAAFVVVLIGTPLLEDLVVHNLRWGVAGLSFLLFVTLLWLALISDRWWILAATGCQLLAVSTYVVALFRPDTLIWTAVTVRWIAWLQQMIICLFAVWEVRPRTAFLQERTA